MKLRGLIPNSYIHKSEPDIYIRLDFYLSIICSMFSPLKKIDLTNQMCFLILCFTSIWSTVRVTQQQTVVKN